MKLATFRTLDDERERVGIVLHQQILPVPPADGAPATLLDYIRSGPEAWQRLRDLARNGGKRTEAVRREDVWLLAPIPRPRKNIICLGWNYAAHAGESARASGTDLKLPEHPVVFTKAPTTVNAPFGDFRYDPQLSTQIDWEVELGVIIGRPGKNIPMESALDHVFGYTVINDLTARDIQQRHRQFFLGKSLDGACPMGPYIVTADEIADPQKLSLRCYVNGVLKQTGHTADQIFNVAQTISILSQGMTLEAGDIIATGTPDGVGYARTPPEFLVDGDNVSCEISGIGRISTRVVASA